MNGFWVLHGAICHLLMPLDVGQADFVSACVSYIRCHHIVLYNITLHVPYMSRAFFFLKSFIHLFLIEVILGYFCLFCSYFCPHSAFSICYCRVQGLYLPGSHGLSVYSVHLYLCIRTCVVACMDILYGECYFLFCWLFTKLCGFREDFSFPSPSSVKVISDMESPYKR